MVEINFNKFQRKSINIDRVKINYLIGGSGPNLLLIHGWPLAFGGEPSWLLEEFAQSFRVYAADLPGFGESDQPNFPITIGNYASLLTKLAKELNLGNHLVASWSFGGMVAIKYAALNKNSISALALCGTAITEKYAANFFLKGLFKFLDRLYDKTPLVEQTFSAFIKNDQALTWLWKRIAPMDKNYSVEEDPSIRELRKLPVSFSRSIFRAGITVDLKKDCQQLEKMPVLILSGEKDRLMTVAAGKEIAGLIELSHHLIVPSAEHWNVIDQKSIEVIIDFFKNRSRSLKWYQKLMQLAGGK
jgi:pimeloyl-ACP methyl ester carboxylesterase